MAASATNLRSRNAKRCVILSIAGLFLLLTIELFVAIRRTKLNNELYTAVENEDDVQVIVLLKSGADPNCAAPEDDPPAVSLIAWLRMLVPHSGGSDSDGSRERPVYIAAKSATFRNSNIPTEKAKQQRDLRILAALLDAGANPNTKSPNTGTPVLLLSEDNEGSVTSTNWDVVSLLLAHGADPGALDDGLLCHALHEGNTSWAKRLIDYVPGARHRETQLIYASRYCRPEIVEYLLQHGAHPDKRVISETNGSVCIEWRDAYFRPVKNPKSYRAIVTMLERAEPAQKPAAVR